LNKRQRIQKILSARGIASRRKAEKMILEGRVCINGIKATIGQSATPEIDKITVDGIELDTEPEHVYLMLNKPAGYLTTVDDDRGRKTVMELIRDAGTRIYPIGRLDLNTEGLLLFTNDGNFANEIMHPSFNKQKTYLVNIRGDITTAVELLRKPIIIDDYTVCATAVEIVNKTENTGTIKIEIAEGRNRQIRKMCTACNLTVKSLKRISIGSLELGTLKPGHWRYLTDEEVEYEQNQHSFGRPIRSRKKYSSKKNS
jgi:23S rRNA pseudouridine2605 synthase